MPEQPETKRRPLDTTALAARRREAAQPRPTVAIPYAELHCKTNFSFLEGASHPDELVHRAAELNYAALAITDRNSLAGVVRAHTAAKQLDLKLLIGAELTPIDAPAVVLFATDRQAYGRLSRLITLGRMHASKGECHLTFDDIADYADGLIAGIVGPESSDCTPLLRYREAFGDRAYLFAELHCGPNDARKLAERIEIARKVNLPLVAANDVHFHHPSRRALADVLACTRTGCTIATAGELLFPNAARHLKSPQEMRELFARVPDAHYRTLEIANRCTFSLDELRYEYPEELAPAGETPLAYLTRLTWQGAANRYSTGIPEKVRRLLEHELQLIAELRYEAYFLTVWDLVKFARAREILCQGRGSAANSAVCFCLGVTSVDPDRMDVLFERFLSRERNEVPDIDVDFEHERREEVIQYVYEKYGRERAGMTAEVITYRPRSAVRDVGKALGLSLDRVDTLAKTLDRGGMKQLVERFSLAGLDPESQVSKQLLGLVRELLGFPRHLGQHVGGLVITQFPLCELVPIENATMENRTVIEWDKDDLDELGILKVDCLSLGMLTAIHKCFDFINEEEGTRDEGRGASDKGASNSSAIIARPSPLASRPSCLTLATVPSEDPATYEMICRADTMGVFQIESRAQMSMLPRLRPQEFYDIVIQVAIVRPGPIQGGMVHPYLRRRAGEEEITYPNEEVRQVLKKTLGVPLFQEQAMQLAVVAAGFTPGEADQLRRAMAAWRRPGIIDNFRQKLLEGMQAKGISKDFAERLFNQIRGFGEYGFPESHAASFALLAYVSAWLKCHYPAAFCAALLNSQPMGFYAPAQLVRDAQAHGVEVRPVDVNHSRWDCTLETTSGGRGRRAPQPEPWSPSPRDSCTGGSLRSTPATPTHALRLGLRMIVGLPQAQAARIEQACAEKPFHSLDDFQRRSGVRATVVERLARADAFQSLALDRRRSLWQALEQAKETGQRPLWEQAKHEESRITLPTMSPQQEVQLDYQTAGLSLKGHPLSFYRAQLNELRITPANQLANLRNGMHVRVAGLVLVRQRPGTAKGITFVTLEDETGVANLIIRMDVWERFYQVARTAPAFIVHGRLQIHQEVIHVLVTKLENLSAQLNALRVHSRDFQ
jgi:error-prone DNA polymerase